MADPLSQPPSDIAQPASPVDFILRQQRDAQSRTMAAVDASPDDAARAIELGQSANVDPVVVLPNLDSFEIQHKAAITSALLRNNQYLTDYVNSTPLAAHVSNDDWGTLDGISHHLQGMMRMQTMFDAAKPIIRSVGSVFEHAYDDVPESEKNNEALAVGHATLNTAVGLGEVALSAPIILASDQAHKLGTAITGNPQAGRQWAENIAGMADAATMAGVSSGLPMPHIEAEALLKYMPWVREGEIPPAGLDKIIDKAKADANKSVLDVVDDAVKEAQKSTTKARAPELFSDFVDQHIGNATMGISGRKVLELYGDKVPEPDDNLLGWVPNIGAQLEAAKDTGADITVPMKDWISKVDPEVHEELHDNLRVIRGGMTVEEAKEAEEPVDTVNDAVAMVRNGAGLEPMFSIGDRKLTLNRMAEHPVKGPFGPEQGFHDFDMVDQNGNNVGSLNISEQKGGKELYVENINGLGDFYHPNNFGPALMRDLLRQIKAQFPNAETLTGHRVSGARGEAGTYDLPSAMLKIRLDESLELTNPEKFSKLLGGAWQDLGAQGLQGYIKPSELWEEHEREIADAVEAELGRIAPKIKGYPVSEIRSIKGPRNIQGLFFGKQPAVSEPFILWAMNADDSVGVARHEAIHSLRRGGFFSDEEWATLEKAAKEGKWAEEFDIAHRYTTQPIEVQTEESIAEAYRHWAEEHELGERKPKSLSPLDNIFERIRDLLETIKGHIRRITGTENFDDLFQRVHSGEIGSREGTEPREVRSGGSLASEEEKRPYKNVPDSLMGFPKRGFTKPYEEQRFGHEQVVRVAFEDGQTFDDAIKGLNREHALERARRNWPGAKIEAIAGDAKALASEERPISEPGQGIEAKSPFKSPRDVGMTLDQHKNYMKLIEARQQADLKASTDRALREQTQRQTKEWKQQSESLRPKVVAELNSRPDIAADKFFGLGELMGQKLDKTYRLDWEALTPEQRKAIPESYTVRKGGVKPDEVAGLFGYQTGDQMIQGLSRIVAERDASGLRRDRWARRMVDNEVQRQMELEHGFLEKNILEDTKDQVLSENQLNLLHEETMHLATMSGATPSTLTQDALRSAIKDKFDALPVGAVSSDKYLREAGKNGRLAELSLLQDNPSEAFKAKQVQYYNAIYADLARKVEKAQKQLDKAAKPFRKADVKGVEPEYLNHIQNLLSQAGYRIGRSPENVEENLQRRGKTVEQFANEKLDESFGYRDIPVADVIVDNAVKPVDEMTTHDFLGFKQTIDALIKNARDEQKIIREGETADRQAVLDEMKSHIERFEPKPVNASLSRWDKLKEIPRQFLAGLTNMETFLNRMGDRNPESVFNRYITYPAASAANRKAALQREYSKIYRSIGEVEDKDKLVPSPLIDPLSGERFTRFTRGNVMQMLANAGNKSNWTVLAKGYGADPEGLMNWLVANTTREDWVRAQRMGKEVFGQLIKLADNEYEHIHGITIDKIPLTEFSNAHGTFEGWYHPLVRDPIREGKSPIRDGAYDDSDFGHITTANGYTRKRSGAAYPLDLNPDMTPVRINQMIHDISFRNFVLQTQKLFKDPALSNTITSHYGKEYNSREFLIPWLKGIAGQESIPSRAAAKANQISEWLRQNVIGTYIGFNPFTAAKHGPTALVMSMRQVGPTSFLKAVQDLYGKSPELGLSNSEFAMKWSEELQRRERHWQDTLFGAHGEIQGANSLREHVLEKGSWLVAKSDMMSAKPTWLAAYRNAQDEGMTHGESIDRADAAVRLAHGSTAITNQPGLVRGRGPLNSWLTSVYGFFGTAMQRRIELAQDIHDTFGLAKQGEITQAATKIPGLMTDIMTYVIWPTIVEEAVTGSTTDDRRGWGTHIATAALLGLSSSVLYARDIVNGLVGGHDVGVGLISSPLHDVVKAVKDVVRKDALTKQRMGKTVGDTLTALGHGTGMAPKTIDNAIHFGIDLVNGQANPKTTGDWLRGVTKGTTKERVEK